MNKIKGFFVGMGKVIVGIFASGYVCGSAKDFCEVDYNDKSSIEKELERLWERYDNSFLYSTKQELMERIKELESKL